MLKCSEIYILYEMHIFWCFLIDTKDSVSVSLHPCLYRFFQSEHNHRELRTRYPQIHLLATLLSGGSLIFEHAGPWQITLWGFQVSLSKEQRNWKVSGTNYSAGLSATRMDPLTPSYIMPLHIVHSMQANMNTAIIFISPISCCFILLFLIPLLQ